MAGIGFKINKMFKAGNISSDILAIAYSVLTSSGPWIITTLTLGFAISIFRITIVSFTAAIVYSFIFSIIISGPFALFFTRRVSDLVFKKEHEKILPETLGIILFGLIFAIIGLILFFIFNPHEFLFILSFAYLFINIFILWIVSIASLSTESINLYILSYILMGFFSILFSLMMGSEENPNGYILGYALGVNLSLIFHFLITINKFGSKINSVSFEWLGEVKKYWQNIFIGLFYYLAIWVDDLVVWFSYEYGEELIKGFKFSYIYDRPMFIAYLTIIPTTTLFVLLLETKFYEKYKLFYQSLSKGTTLKNIREIKEKMLYQLKSNMKIIISAQIIITSILLIFNELGFLPFISEIFKPILRLGLFGAMMNSFYLMIMLLILYFDFRELALILNIAVFSLNLVLSIIFLKFSGLFSLGASYLISFTLGTFIGYKILMEKLKDIIKIEYSRQKFGLKKGIFLDYQKIKEKMEEIE